MFKNQSGASIKVFLIIVVVILGGLYATTDYLQKGYQFAMNQISGSAQQVTYYQWTDANGEMVISRTKPTNTDNYISFKAAEDLIKSENNVDQALIEKGYAAQQGLNQQAQQKSGGQTKSNGSVLVGPINSYHKAKHCTDLTTQIQNEKRKGGNAKGLVERHKKEC